MKVVISLQLTLQAVVLIVLLAAGSADGAGTARRHPHAREHLGSKVEYCTDCHGLSGQGYRGFLIMPRLAGQTTEYLENQLRAFVERRRGRNIIIPMGRVHDLSPSMRATLAEHFRQLNPRPSGGASNHLAATGEKIYQEGIPEANVPACSACHGPEARGEGANPRLAGQLYPYTVKELTNWSKERGQGSKNDDPSAIMLPIARSLTQSQIAAIAAYLSYLR